MSTISPGIGKCGDNIYDHRREEERAESRFERSGGGSSRPMTKIGPEITTEGRRKGTLKMSWELGKLDWGASGFDVGL